MNKEYYEPGGPVIVLDGGETSGEDRQERRGGTDATHIDLGIYVDLRFCKRGFWQFWQIQPRV